MFHAEGKRVHHGVLALLEHPTLEAHLHAVGIELFLHHAGPQVLVLAAFQRLHGALQHVVVYGLQQCACEMRLGVSIHFLVLLEIVLKGCGILGSRFPHLSLAHFEQQQAVVVFLEQVAQLLILGSHALGLLVHHLLHGLAHGAAEAVGSLSGEAVAHAACLQELTDTRSQRVVGLEGLLVHELQDMPAHGREHRLCHLARSHRVGLILYLLEQLMRTYPTYYAATGCRAAVVGSLRGQLCKVLASGQFGINAVDARLGGSLRRGIALLRHMHEDMRQLQQLLTLKLCQHLVVVVAHLLLLGFGCHQQRPQLLVAVGAVLLLVARQRIELSINGGLHLQLVVDEQVGIFLYAFLVYHAVGVVLVVVVFKLRTGHGLAVDAHHYRVISLRGHRLGQEA